MQILFETALFCLAIVAPALLASSFKSDSAGTWSKAKVTHGEGASTGYELADKPAARWLGKRKRAITI